MAKQLLISVVLLMASVLALRFGAGIELPFYGTISLYFGLYLLVGAVLGRGKRGGPEEQHPGITERWPVSGPIGSLGGNALAAVFTVTAVLSLLNPFLLVQNVLQIVGNAWLSLRSGGKDELGENKASYRLPFDGEWLVLNGGVTPATSHSWGIVTQRYAYDFVVADAENARHLGAGTRGPDYYCFDKPILAAADGEVVAVLDAVGQAPFLGYGVADFLARSLAGNHVTIRHAEGEYGFYAHLRRGSVGVKVGDRVSRGQEIGRCGHTGNSTEPHLHFHLQDRVSFFFGRGLPIRFAASVPSDHNGNGFLRCGDRCIHGAHDPDGAVSDSTGVDRRA